MSLLKKLEAKWGVTTRQVIVILVVFALTGTTVMLLKKPVVAFFTGGEKSTLFSIIYYILIFPIYNVLLLAYGWIFGQFSFFWKKEKRMLKRIFRRT